MTKSLDLRRQAVKVYRETDMPRSQIAALFGIHRSTMYRWTAKPLPTQEELDQKPETRGRKSKLGDKYTELLRVLAQKHCDATETELAQMIYEAGGPLVGRSSIGRAIRKMGLTKKKNMVDE